MDGWMGMLMDDCGMHRWTDEMVSNVSLKMIGN